MNICIACGIPAPKYTVDPIMKEVVCDNCGSSNTVMSVDLANEVLHHAVLEGTVVMQNPIVDLQGDVAYTYYIKAYHDDMEDLTDVSGFNMSDEWDELS